MQIPFKLTIIAATIVLTACSTTPTNTSLLDDTRLEYQNARSNPDVRQYASAELTQSAEALDKANAASTNRDSAQKVDELAYLAKQKITVAENVAKQKVAEKVLADADKRRNQVQLNERNVEVSKANANANIANTNADIANQVAAASQEDAQQAQAKAARLEQELADLHAQKTDHGIIITFGDILFNTNESRLNASGVGVVQKLATILNENPQRNVLINGYTDSTGTAAYNLALSERRAGAVSDILAESGINRQRITTHGYGEGSPIAANNSSENRQLNRRVEITLSDANGTIAHGNNQTGTIVVVSTGQDARQ